MANPSPDNYPSSGLASEKSCHLERSLTRILRQTESKDLRLHLGTIAASLGDKILGRIDINARCNPLIFKNAGRKPLIFKTVILSRRRRIPVFRDAPKFRKIEDAVSP